MKYLIDGEEYTDVSEAAEYISEQISEDEYDEMLDECYPDCEICSCSFNSSYALRELDITVYDIGFDEYKDSRRDDIQDTLERMDDDDDDYICGCSIKAVDDDEEEEDYE